MKMSVFTPTNRKDTRWLVEAWNSLLQQTYTNWQWVLVPNNGVVIPSDIANDNRVKIFEFDGKPIDGDRYSIGALKKFACSHCTGDVLVELDDDDMLTSDALECVAKAYSDRNIQVAYSNTAEFIDGTWESKTYTAWWGWKTRPYVYNGHQLQQNVAWPPMPQAMRRIYWSPNHLRSWRTTAYFALGGHNPDLALVDDHDLNIRSYLMFGAAGIRHIDKCLYLYRYHGGSTCRKYSTAIQVKERECYAKYISDMAVRWSRDNGLKIYDLGGALDPCPGFETVDMRPEADVVADLSLDWPFDNNSVGLIRASHIFEHLPDPVHTMNELFRVLAPGGFALIEVPSTDGRGAFQDPTHVSFWNENSFWYYTRKGQAKYIQPRYTGRFQVSELMTYFPNKQFKQHNIPVVRAHLIALKPGYEERRAGEILI